MRERAHREDDTTADLVGWARRNPLSRGLPQDPDRSRKVLSAALGLSPDQLASLDDAEITVALERLRNLVDHWQALASAAETDDLTGALRRGAGLGAVKRELDRSRRHPLIALSILFLDVDKLKVVNDQQGHAAGDALLRGVVTAIRKRLRSYDLIVRYGGDEFVCCLSGVDMTRAQALALDIQRAVKLTTTSTVSIGIATLNGEDDVESLIARADADLYKRRAAVAARR
jgi:diguanylate cyclase (GGDEF)-like protein